MNSIIAPSLLAVISSDPHIASIGDSVGSHRVFGRLLEFGREMKARPLDAQQRRTLLASLWTFFEQFPTGILALTVRACDEWARRDPWSATSMGANVLFADVDEFGLNNVADRIYPSHHQMFLEFANHLGVKREDLLSTKNVVHGAYTLAKLVHELYRHAPLGNGLGMHFASELVASVEFQALFDGFRTHKQAYGFSSDEDEALTFIRIHTTVEPKHLGQNCELIKTGLQEGMIRSDDVVSAAVKYLDQFDLVYQELNHTLFGLAN